MKNFNRLSTAGLVFCVGIVTLFASVAVNAQDQGRYAARYSKRDVSSIIARLEQSSNTFRRDFDRAMDRSNLNGTDAEDRFNNIVGDFEDSVDRLRNEFDRGDSWWQSRNNVENTLRDSRPVNTMMTTISFRRNIERQWNQLRNDINTLADTYDLPGLNGGGWNGGGGGGNDGNWGGGGGQTINPPNWAQGTFYGSAQDGTRITLTISRNGSVNADIGGRMNYGTFTRSNNLQIAGAVARVTRQGNGILTTRTDTGERIAYTRDGGYNGGGGGNESGNQISPPNWARGSFYGRASNGGAQIVLTISSDGSVTAVIDGQPIYGSFTQGNILSIAGAYARVTSIRSGIRTVRTDNGETIDYRRQ